MGAVVVIAKLLILGLLLPYFYLEALSHYCFRRKKNLRGKVVVITGAGSGIGRLLSRRLAALGCYVIGWDVNEEGLKETSRLVEDDVQSSNQKSEGVAAFRYYLVDVSKPEVVYEIAARITEPVDIVINNAGIVSGSKFILETEDEKIVKTFQVNSMAHFWVVKAFLGQMLERDSGHIVTVASVAGLQGIARLVDYCASKFAAVGFDEALTWELRALGKKGVKTTVVCPYVVDTGLFEGAGRNAIPWLLPVLSPEYVADRIVRGVQLDERQVFIPRSGHLFQLVRALVPRRAWVQLVEIVDLDKTMNGFKGRQS